MLAMIKKHRDHRYTQLVADAFASPDNEVHRTIKHRAAQWMGLQRTWRPARLRRAFLHRVLKAVRARSRENLDLSLGYCPVGIANIQIECFASDSNTASVYLYGFSDNLPIFDVYKRHVRPGSATVDVGANVGIHSLIMANLVGTGGKVHAYEPAPSIFERLLRNIQFNQCSNINARNVAASNQICAIGFADVSDRANIGQSHVDPSATTTVQSVTLDSELMREDSISLIKVDVEGHELEVLKGAQEILSVHRPAVVLEFNGESYSITDLCRSFPYPIDVFRIPSTYYERIVRLNLRRTATEGTVFNALITPAS